MFFSIIFFLIFVILIRFQRLFVTEYEEIQLEENQTSDTNEVKCYKAPKNWMKEGNIEVFEDVLTANMKLMPSKSIIFLETSCFKNGLFVLNAR